LFDILRSDFEAFDRRELTLVTPGEEYSFVLDRRTRVRFHHQFARGGKLTPPDFLKDYEPFAAKFRFLAERFRASLRGGPVCFVRRDMTHAEAVELEAIMEGRFPNADMRFVYVNDARETFATGRGRSLCLPRPRTGLGDSVAWSRLLTDLGLVERPFRLATPQIVDWRRGERGLDVHGSHSVASLATAHRVNPGNPWFACELGAALLAKGKYRSALRLAEEALAGEPENPTFLELKLRSATGVRALAPESALSAALTALDRAPHDGLFTYAAGLLVDLGRWTQAIELADRGLALSPRLDRLVFQQARAMLGRGDACAGEQLVDRALAMRPLSKSYVAMKGELLCARGRQAEALDLVGHAVRSKFSVRLFAVYVRLIFRQSRRIDGGGHHGHLAARVSRLCAGRRPCSTFCARFSARRRLRWRRLSGGAGLPN
jgi:tetratricopeptide (TPR) repeat protein